jgi:putative tricarboxylic transport membrane protein
MHLSDRTTGVVLVGVGALAIFGASRLPPMPGQEIGPSVFPTVIGAGLALCGAMIALGIGRTFEEEAEADLAAHQDPLQRAEAVQSPLHGLRALIPIALLLFYVLAADAIGFVPIATIIVATMALSLGANWKHGLALALIAPPIVHLLFSKLLRVPLPIGLLPMPW